MADLIVKLEKVKQKERFGTKALNLARLQKWGFKLPLTWVVSTAALNELLKDNQQWKAWQQKQLVEQVATLDQMQALILEQPLPAKLHRALEKALHDFQQQKVKALAVRSSALGEDRGDFSFAGQYATQLNVAPQLDDLWAAIKKVWASLFNPEVWEYCRKNDLPPPPLKMGVVLQEMVPAQWAGVAFSVNPNQPEQEKILIEFVQGLGEKLVSGQANPQQVEIDRYRLETANPLPFDLPQVQILVNEILRLERLSGRIVDVEWAFAQGAYYFLQFRPVTTLQNVIIWTRENVGEVIPDVVTPFTWSILEPMTNGAYRYFLKKVGLKIKQKTLFALYKGKVYFNHNAYRQMIEAFYVSHYLVPGQSKLRSLVQLTRLLLLLFRLWILSFRLPRKIEKRLRKAQLQFSELQHSSASPIKNVQQTLRVLNHLMQVHVTTTILAEFYYQLLNKVCHETLQTTETDASKLLQGIGQIESIKPTLALWEIAHWIQVSEPYHTLFKEKDVEELLSWWKTLPDNDVFKKEMHIFLENFGYVALHEFELSFPRWHEDLHYIFNTLKQYVQTPEGYLALNRHYQQTERDRKTIVENFRQRFKTQASKVQIFLFEYLLKKAEYFSFQRENLKQKILQWLNLLKTNLLTIGKQRLSQPQDIFFLTLNEIEEMVKQPALVEELALKIKERKVHYNEQLREKHPEKIRQIGQTWVPIFEHSVTGNEMQGFACSAGVVEGRAHVILDAQREGRQFQPGEILVTRATNPGWTPLLALAGGIVTELGGALSHGAIIAREFSIPMVAAVEQATQKIKTGQWIRVNGQTGTVEILKEDAH